MNSPSPTKLTKRLFYEQSNFQKIEVYQTEHFGKALYLDDFEQFCEADEIKYHQAMTKVPILIHGKTKSVLIIGGGDGAIARECLKYKNINCIDQCEIDKKVVAVCKEFFPNMACSFDNPKVNLIYDDAKEFVKQSNKKYDVILVDSTDPVNRSKPLFEKIFYEDLKKLLNKNGILCCQMQTPAVNFGLGSKVFSYLYETFSDLKFFFSTYARIKSNEYTLFSISSDAKINVPISLSPLFMLFQPEYKKVKKFLDKMSWIKN
tara:strand:+ start:1773 stop:2558 length:786 start_codon:yes stop_codon:yes gene_type:complete